MVLQTASNRSTVGISRGGEGCDWGGSGEDDISVGGQRDYSKGSPFFKSCKVLTNFFVEGTVLDGIPPPLRAGWAIALVVLDGAAYNR